MNPAAPAFDVSGLLEMMLSLMLVIALIVGLSWVVARMRNVQRSSSGAMGVLAELVIGPKERIVLVRVGDAQALVGISGAGVTSLQLLDRTLQVAPPASSGLPNAASFAQKLKDMMNRSHGEG
jgi:flagellar protein FliO/FliZ